MTWNVPRLYWGRHEQPGSTYPSNSKKKKTSRSFNRTSSSFMLQQDMDSPQVSFNSTVTQSSLKVSNLYSFWTTVSTESAHTKTLTKIESFWISNEKRNFWILFTFGRHTEVSLMGNFFFKVASGFLWYLLLSFKPQRLVSRQVLTTTLEQLKNACTTCQIIVRASLKISHDYFFQQYFKPMRA